MVKREREREAIFEDYEKVYCNNVLPYFAFELSFEKP